MVSVGIKKARFLVQVSYPTFSHKSERIVSLRIVEDDSNQTVIEADISAQDWVGIQSSLGVYVEGVMTGHPERLGRVMIVESDEVRSYGTDAVEKANALAEIRKAAGWDEVDVKKHNYGYGVHCRMWVDADDERAVKWLSGKAKNRP